MLSPPKKERMTSRRPVPFICLSNDPHKGKTNLRGVIEVALKAMRQTKAAYNVFFSTLGMLLTIKYMATEKKVALTIDHKPLVITIRGQVAT